MKHRSLALSMFLIGMGAAASIALAQQTATPQTVTVATVNVQNAKITSQTGNEISIVFNITNRTGTQPEIKYGVILLQQESKGQTVTADEKIYDQIVSLNANDGTFQEITYTPPSYIKGTYSVMIEAENPQGLILGEAFAGTATFAGSAQYLEVIPNSCYLTVTDDATSTEYTLTQGVDILPSEHLLLHCTVQNNEEGDTTFTPTFDTYYRTVFGMLVATSTLAPVTVPAQGAPLAETFDVPIVATPQAYDAVFNLADDQEASSSNNVIVHYVVQGESATVQNVVFDKSSYQAGDTAQLSVFWTGSAGNFDNSRLSPTQTGPITATVNVESGTNVSCASPINQTIPEDQPSANFSIPITSNCPTPKALVTLADSTGIVLAQTYFATGTPMPAPEATSVVPQTSSSGMGMVGWAIVLIIIILVIIGIIYFIKKSKGGNKPPDIGGVAKVILFLVVITGGVMHIHPAKADTVISTIDLPAYYNKNGKLQGNHYEQVTYTFNIDQATYPPAGQLTAIATVTGAVCDNGDSGQPTLQTITATANSVQNTLIDGKITSLTMGQATYTVQSVPGNYDAVFNAQGTVDYYGTNPTSTVIIHATPITDSIPYAVAIGGATSTTSTSTSPTSTAPTSTAPLPPPSTPPACTFFSNPSNIVVPESSNLIYSCQNVTLCDLSGGQFGPYPGVSVPINSDDTASSTRVVNPTTDTVYELDCSEAGSGVSYSDLLQTDVIVDASNRGEVAP